jgi:hypothetical protein
MFKADKVAAKEIPAYTVIKKSVTPPEKGKV